MIQWALGPYPPKACWQGPEGAKANGVAKQATWPGSLNVYRLAEVTMSDRTANQMPDAPGPATIAEIIRGLEPMGDPSKFSIEDLTAEEEDAFFAIIENL